MICFHLCVTNTQVDFVKLLFDKLGALSLRHADTADEWRFPRPSFKVRCAAASAFLLPPFCQAWKRARLPNSALPHIAAPSPNPSLPRSPPP